MVNGRLPGLLAAVALTVAACGGADETASASPPAAPPASSRPSTQAPAPQTETREVTLEVNGKGKVFQPIVYAADTDGTESDVTLPWKKTVTIELTEAEQKVGYLVSVIPGAVRDAKGMLRPARCRILVDGKEVATNDAGENMCKHTLK
ncbi:hypothetical protein FHR32_002461 [Streptosporangium album]|uniref:Uncharacterized protein n=1 Tax=Streptosporangium album TaxID=47479 RepID=A0A7W7RVJ6_9ACTN|nr:hypothetical protein [Streptosporangium album]MBB4938156.1 hypothetical protein [Streptosporangium album]